MSDGPKRKGRPDRADPPRNGYDRADLHRLHRARSHPITIFEVLLLVVVFYLVGSIWQIVSDPGLPATLDLLLLVAICVIVWFLRIWPLKVQDRLIRLEETLRMREVLPEELRTRIGELRRRHFIALRFAPDEELPGLVQRVLDGELTTGKEIKQAIRSWRADHFRV